MTWGTGDELRFLRGIGIYSNDTRNRTPDKFRLDLLVGYRQGMKHRTDWDKIDRESVRTYVDGEIARLTTQHKPSAHKGGV